MARRGTALSPQAGRAAASPSRRTIRRAVALAALLATVLFDPVPFGAVPFGDASPLGLREAAAAELDPGANTAAVINTPTALDQPAANMARGILEIADLSAPDLRLASLGYSRQLGNLQLLLDAYARTQPRNFDRAELKGKLRIVNLEALHTHMAIGALARWSDQEGKDAARLDNKPYSLLGVLTTEIFPFDQWGAFLLNVYVDNRFANAGLKVQLYEGIKFVAETDYHHGNVAAEPRPWRYKAGLEFEGDRNFYAQLFYDDDGNHTRLQIGSGF
jgi:hypothetical protein